MELLALLTRFNMVIQFIFTILSGSTFFFLFLNSHQIIIFSFIATTIGMEYFKITLLLSAKESFECTMNTYMCGHYIFLEKQGMGLLLLSTGALSLERSKPSHGTQLHLSFVIIIRLFFFFTENPALETASTEENIN